MSELSQPLIVCAAMQNANGVIIPSPRHFDRTCRALLDAISDDNNEWVQGFIDQHGAFYSRDDAFKIATANNQIRRPSSYETNILYSENLY